MNYIGYIKKLLRKPIGAMPVGLSVTVYGVKLGFERQFEIDGKVRLDVVSGRKKVISIDGVFKNKPSQIKKLTDFVFKNSKLSEYDRKNLSVNDPIFKKLYGNKIKKLVDNLSQEVRGYNSPKKTSTKKATTKKAATKKAATKKATPKKATTKSKGKSSSKGSPITYAGKVGKGNYRYVYNKK